jgi:hypothetical protein
LGLTIASELYHVVSTIGGCMNWIRVLSLSACIALSACGGGGGGVNVAPAPPVAPAPTPTNTTLTDLKASQSFTNDASANTLTLDLTTNTAVTGKNVPGTLTISYNVANNSYSVASGGRSQTFLPSDVETSSPAEVRYRKVDGDQRDILTLVKIPYTGTSATQYVGLGYWQRNNLTGSRQDTEFSTFAYGLETPAAAVPRTGTAAFRIDVFGLVSTPGFEQRRFEGAGVFSADFAAGVFSAFSYNTETGVSTGNGVIGGGIDFTSAGTLSSTGNFSGNMLYGGTNGSIAGSLAGRFYGPTGQEIGASFAGGDASGAAVTGAFTGARDATAPIANLTLTNLTSSELFYVPFALLTRTAIDGQAGFSTRTYSTIGQLNRQNAETFTYGPGLSNLPGGQFTINDKFVSADPNFTGYRKTFNGDEVVLELYKPGSGNTELPLTYASLGRWNSASKNGVVTESNQVFLAYGLQTPARLLSAKTGTGRYAGVVYGAGANPLTAATYDVKGTSLFNVDFANQNYSGALVLAGTGTNGTPSIDFGSYDFAGDLAQFTAATTAALAKLGVNVGEITTRFYGPDGEEMAGTFILTAPAGSPGAGTTISGATVAKRQ